jgi:hypothetical protein
MKKRIEKMWFWIKKDDPWKNFHKFFKDFEKDYLIIMLIIRQTRNLQKMIDEIMNHIAEWWKFNFRIFKELKLHTLKAIKKCARVDYIIIIDHTRFDVDFSRLMREHLCKICMREKSLKRRKISLYASSERSQWASYSTYYVYFLLYLWLFFLLS